MSGLIPRSSSFGNPTSNPTRPRLDCKRNQRHQLWPQGSYEHQPQRDRTFRDSDLLLRRCNSLPRPKLKRNAQRRSPEKALQHFHNRLRDTRDLGARIQHRSYQNSTTFVLIQDKHLRRQVLVLKFTGTSSVGRYAASPGWRHGCAGCAGGDVPADSNDNAAGNDPQQALVRRRTSNGRSGRGRAWCRRWRRRRHHCWCRGSASRCPSRSHLHPPLRSSRPDGGTEPGTRP